MITRATRLLLAAVSITMLGACSGDDAPKPTVQRCVPNSSTQVLDLSAHTSPDALAIVAANTANSPMPVLTATSASLVSNFLGQGRQPTVWSATGTPEAIPVGLQAVTAQNTASKNNLRIRNNLARIENAMASPPSAAGMSMFEGIGLAADAVRSGGAESPWVIVIGSGLDDVGSMATTSGLLTEDPALTADAVAADNPGLDLTGVTVLMQSLGYTAPPQAAPTTAQRDAIRSAWETTLTRLGASVIVDSFPAAPCSVTTDLPVATTEFPAPVVTCVADEVRFEFPAAILFDGDSSTLRDGADDELRSPVDLLWDNPGVRADVVGHTASSSRYTAEELQELSRSRAQAVADVLTAAGIDAARLTVTGVGDTAPLAEDIGPDGRQNEFAAAERRVGLVLTGVPSCPEA